MSFQGTDRDYDRFMGRFSRRLAPLFADFAGVGAGLEVVDVGCGPGALTGELVSRVGERRVAAADPTEHFVASTGARFPEAEVVQAPAESLPFADARFDAALAQLVVAFMSDADAGIAEMARVARPGAAVAVCMWQPDDAMELLHAVNAAARAVAPDHPANRRARPYRTEAEGRALLERAGLEGVETTELEVTADYEGLDDLAAPVLAGTGPLAPIVTSLDDDGRRSFLGALAAHLGHPQGPFSLTGRAWAARGLVPA
jgi:ubiquinone/menaquinone biosynthesis C-methylase UbiE